MSRFSHRQPIWTFGPVVLLSTLLLSPVAASVVLRALIQAMPQSERIALRLLQRTPVPVPESATDNERINGEPRRIEEETAEGDALIALSDNESEEHSEATLKSTTLADIAFLLPKRIVLTLPDAPPLILRPAPDCLLWQKECQPTSPPRAPPIKA